MEKKRKENNKTAAVISLGSNVIKMRVNGIQNGKIYNIDNLETATNLGHEIFNNNKISFECLRKISTILKGYSAVLKEYGINNVRLISSTFFREAENASYVIDQLKIQNDMNLEVLEDGEEKSLIYSEIIKQIQADYKNVLIAYIGSSSIGVSIFSGGNITFYQNVRIGSLKLHDLLGKIQDQTTDFHTVLEEYLDRMIGRINIPIKKEEISKLILAGSQVKLIGKLCKAPNNNKLTEIDANDIFKLYESINKMTGEMISEKYNISQNEAELLFTNLAIYEKLIKLANIYKVSFSNVELLDPVIHQVLSPKSVLCYESHIQKSAISCAKKLAMHFGCSSKHQEAVYNYAVLLFEKMGKIHGLKGNKKLLLELAIILHECGYFVNSKYPRISTFDIIKNMELYGLTKDDVITIANILRYDELTVPTLSDSEYLRLSEKNKLLVSKMVAIFRLSNALDKSKKQKFKSIKVRFSDEKLIIVGESDENVYLERWAFDKCVPFFEEVFGVTPQLVVKTLLYS